MDTVTNSVVCVKLAVKQIAYGVMVEVLPLVRVTVSSQPDPSATGASTSTLKCTV